MLCVLSIIYEKLLGFILLFWGMISSYINVNFKYNKDINKNSDNLNKVSENILDNELSNSCNSLSTISSLIFPSSKASSNTSSSKCDSPIPHPLYFVEDFISDFSESQSFENISTNKLEKIKSTIKRNKSSASKLNLYFSKDNLNLLLNRDRNKKIKKEEPISYTKGTVNNEEKINKSTICKRCYKNISQYFTKAYYRYKDNSICYDCYDNLKKELTLSR